MCGLAGVMKHNLTLGNISRFRDLMAMAQLRGDDGSGVIAVPKANGWNATIKNVKMRRSTWSSGHLVTTKEFYDTIKGDQSILIGHARQPTKGGNNIENVHPHRSGDIILVHNGTMSHVGNKSVPNGESDSKMIADCIRTHGIDYFVQNSYGAYALVWVDLNKQTMNFLRNGERTLYLCEEKFSNIENSSTEALYWCSELGMLNLALARYAGYFKDRHKYKALPENMHYEYPLAFVGMIPEPTVTERKKTYTHVSNNTYFSGDDWAFGGHDPWAGEDQTPVLPFTGGTTNASTRKVGETTGPFLPQIIGPRGFAYIPPAYRASAVTSVDTSSSTSVRSVSFTLLESKRIAMRNAEAADKAKKGGAATAVSFPADKLADLVLKDTSMVREYVACAPCVWCSDKPLWKNGVPPTIYPLKFTGTRYDYICEGCVADGDVQQMLGVA